MISKRKFIIVNVLVLIIGIIGGTTLQYLTGKKANNELVKQLEDAATGVLLYSMGYSKITNAIGEFNEAYPEYTSILLAAPSFQEYADSKLYEKIEDWESKEHKYSIL